MTTTREVGALARYSEISTRPMTLGPTLFEPHPPVSEPLCASSVFGLTLATSFAELASVPELVFDEERQIAFPQGFEGAGDLDDLDFYRVWAATIMPTLSTGTIYLTPGQVRDRDSDPSDSVRD